jgi:hypothetical protein
MYVEIASHNSERESRGKTSWINVDIDSHALAVSTSSAEHLGFPKWHLELKANCTRDYSNGERGGDMLSIDYDLTIELTPKDVLALVRFAISEDLVSIAANLTKKQITSSE